MGWISAICLALCAVPLAWEAYEEREIDVNRGFLILWTVGEAAGLIYVWGDAPLMFNYGVNCLLLLIVWRYNGAD